MGAGKLELTLVSATNLKSEQEIDAYTTIRCGKQRSTTHTAKDQGSLPSWNQSFEFEVEDSSLSDSIFFQVFGVKPELDELLGTAGIPISKAVSTDSELLTLNKPGGAGEAGQLKVKFKWHPKVTQHEPTAPPFYPSQQIETAFNELNLNKSPPPPAASYPPPAGAPYPPPGEAYPAYPPPSSYYSTPTYDPTSPPPPPPTAPEYYQASPPAPPYGSTYAEKDTIYAPQGGTISLHPPSSNPVAPQAPDSSSPVTSERGLGDKGKDKGKSGYPPSGYGYPPPDPYGYPPQQPGYPPQQHGYPPQQHGYPPAGYPPAPSGYPPAGYPPAGSSHGAPPHDSRLGGHGITGAITGALTGAAAHGIQNMLHGGHRPPYGGYGPGYGQGYGHGYGPGYGHGYGHGPVYGHGKHGKHGKYKHGHGGYMGGHHGGYYGHGKHKHGKHGFFGKHKHGKFGKWK